MKLVQYMWQNWEIPTDLGWMILAPIPKVNTNIWDIGVVEDIIKTHIKACINFHDILHGLCAVIVTGTSIPELKLA